MKAAEIRNLNNLNQKKMKTLFERLKPEHISSLDAKADEFPHLVKAIKLELQQNHHITDLKYGTVITMQSHYNIYKFQDFLNLFEEHE